MATIVSLYTDAVTANVLSDELPPEPPVLGIITASQDTNGGAIPQGRTSVTLNWTAPTLNERLPGEFLVQADGLEQIVETVYDPIAASPVHKLYEVTGRTGGLSNLGVAAAQGDKVITVVSAVGFAPNDWVELAEGANQEFAQIQSIDGLNLTLYNRLRNFSSWTTSATVTECQVSLKTITTDYTLVTSTGVFTLLAGQFTSGNDVFVEYSVTLQDLDHFELYRIPGNLPVTEPADYATVTGHGSVVTVDNAIVSGATQKVDVTAAAQNGQTWTYYLFAMDDEATPNASIADAVMVEMFTTIPQNLAKSVGENQVILSWDAVGDTNFDGANIYRCSGTSFIAGNAEKVNSSLVTDPSFDDSAGNGVNRVAEGTLAYPANGLPYTYKIESEDNASAWTTGTQNQRSGQSEQLTAQKSA